MSKTILNRIAGGDAAAVEECLNCYGGLVWSLACRFSLNDSEAEDAAQEIFIDLWRNAWRYDETRGTEIAFVSTLARRRLIDRNRKLQRTLSARNLPDFQQIIDGSTVELSSNASDDIERLKQCLKLLRDKDKLVIELSVYSGLSQTQISDTCEIPLGTVKTVIRRVLIGLRKCMGAAATEEIASYG